MLLILSYDMISSTAQNPKCAVSVPSVAKIPHNSMQTFQSSWVAAPPCTFNLRLHPGWKWSNSQHRPDKLYTEGQKCFTSKLCQKPSSIGLSSNETCNGLQRYLTNTISILGRQTGQAWLGHCQTATAAVSMVSKASPHESTATGSLDRASGRLYVEYEQLNVIDNSHNVIICHN